MPSIGIPGVILILLLALLLFGPSKLPELGRAFGRTLREFKKGSSELLNDTDAKAAVIGEGTDDSRKIQSDR